MFKRLIWWGTGALMGAGGSWWAKRKVKQVVVTRIDNAKAALSPRNIAGNTRRRVGNAIEAGKWAAHDRENDLRRQLELARSKK